VIVDSGSSKLSGTGSTRVLVASSGSSDSGSD
jgi:hypothetical protein